MLLRETEGADPSVIYEDRHLEVMNKRPIAKKKQSAHILQESGVLTFQLGHEVKKHLSQRKYMFSVAFLSSVGEQSTCMSDATEVQPVGKIRKACASLSLYNIRSAFCFG